MAQDEYNRKSYAAAYFAIAMVLAAAYIILKDLGILK